MLTNKERITKIINRKARCQTVNKTDTEQSVIAEKQLSKLLEDICYALDISLCEWNKDKELLLLILKHPKACTQRQKERYSQYDAVYKLIKSLHIKISPKYRWFTNIATHLNNKQK